MRIPAACVSESILGLMPFSGLGATGGSAVYRPLSDPLPYQKMYEWQWRVKSFLLEIEITFDAGTVSPGAPNPGTYTMVLTRTVAPFASEQERALIRPGAQDDFATPTDGLCEWTCDPLVISLPGDDYFNSITWTATMRLCSLAAPTGFTATGDAGLPANRYAVDEPSETFEPTLTLVIDATYDDGTEGTLTIQLHDPDLSPSPPSDVIPMDGSIDGRAFSGYAIGFTPTYAAGGVAPVVTLTPLEWYEYRRTNGTEPIFDSTDGTVLPGQTPFTNVL